jgi:hypothetical protein
MLELVFRFAISASNTPHAYYDPVEQILRLDVNGPRSGTHTVGKVAQVQGKWQVNNFGWNSEIDYERDRNEKPRIAIIGDSFIVALHVDVEESMPGLLRRRIGDQTEVYSFGTRGAPMSQYLQMSRYVNRNFDPDILVFNIVNNDFDRSMCEIAWDRGMMCLDHSAGEITESGIVPYSPSKKNRLARKSSLVRYLYLNLSVATRFGIAQAGPAVQSGAVAAASPYLSIKDRIEDGIDYLLRTIAEENPDKTVIFVMDGPRLILYGDELSGKANMTEWKHGLMRSLTSKYGFHFIDLTDNFNERYDEYGERFNSKIDYHWNANGHEVAAQALLETLQDIDAIAK